MNADILINDIKIFKDVKLHNASKLVVSFDTNVPVTSTTADYLLRMGASMNFYERKTFVALPMKDVKIVFK